jgi:hypothetical protein
VKLLTFVCCEQVIQDVRHNSMSLINLLEDIAAPSFPMAMGRLTAYGFLEKESSDREVQVGRLRATINDQQIADLEVNFDFQGKPRTRIIGELQGFPILAPGRLKFAILAGDPLTELGEWVIHVSSLGVGQVDLFTSPSGETTQASG